MKLLGLGIILGILFISEAKDTLNPEEALFVITRCVEDCTKSKSKVDKNDQLKKWIDGEYNDNDETDHCFVRCMLETGGIFDKDLKKLDVSKIKKQYYRYAKFKELGLTKQKVNLLLFDAKATKTFEPIMTRRARTEEQTIKIINEAFFKAYINLLRDHWDTLKALYFLGDDKSKPVYNQMGDKLKQQNESFISYCEKLYYPKSKPERQQELCELRQYKMFDSENFRAFIHCIFHGFRYINDDFEVQVDEILRDFALVSNEDKRHFVDECIKAEPLPVGNKERSEYIMRCLLEKTPDVFKKAFDYREVRSASYISFVEAKDYNKDDIDEKVKQLDVLACPESEGSTSTNAKGNPDQAIEKPEGEQTNPSASVKANEGEGSVPAPPTPAAT